jgi:hypothetical protein
MKTKTFDYDCFAILTLQESFDECRFLPYEIELPDCKARHEKFVYCRCKDLPLDSGIDNLELLRYASIDELKQLLRVRTLKDIFCPKIPLINDCITVGWV